MKEGKTDPIQWAQPKQPAKPERYKPGPHPQQHRLDEARKIPSLWTPGTTYPGERK